jgi:hypothetical protein
VLLPLILSRLSTNNCWTILYTKDMVKLTYDAMRRLSEIGEESGKLTIKNKDGKVLQHTLKRWGPSETQKGTRSTCLMAPQGECHGNTGSPLQICPHPTSSQRPRPQERP